MLSLASRGEDDEEGEEEPLTLRRWGGGASASDFV